LDSCGADADLVALAKDCLAREREDRPRDAGVLAERITAHLAGVQEKLRIAERERAVADARAAEEQKRRVLADRLASQERARRRATVGLAASLLALITLGGGGAAWYAQQR